jgi:hypothetical protein
MSTHPYLRAYLAGVFVPTLVLPLILVVFITLRLVLGIPFPIERFLIFPMSIVPSNILYYASRKRTRLPIGVHGAILPLLGAPTGAFVAHCLGMLQFGATGVTKFQAYQIPYPLAAAGLLAGVAGYYLIWKYIIGPLNAVLGIA